MKESLASIRFANPNLKIEILPAAAVTEKSSEESSELATAKQPWEAAPGVFIGFSESCRSGLGTSERNIGLIPRVSLLRRRCGARSLSRAGKWAERRVGTAVLANVRGFRETTSFTNSNVVMETLV